MNEKTRYNKIQIFLDKQKPESLEDAVTILKTKNFFTFETEQPIFKGTWLDVCFDGDETRLRELFESSGGMFRWITGSYSRSGLGNQSRRITPETYDHVVDQSPEGVTLMSNLGSNPKMKWNPVVMTDSTVSKEFFSLEKGEPIETKDKVRKVA
jgi:hypothetical protein